MTDKPAIPVQADEKDWRYKVLRKCRGNQSIMGSIIIAALGKSMSVGSRKNIFTGSARLDKDHVLHATFIDKYGVVTPDFPIIKAKELSDNLRRLAMDCHLEDAEATALFTTVREWVYTDENASSTLQ